MAKPEPPFWITAVGVLSKLALVLGLAYVALGVYKKYGQGGRAAAAARVRGRGGNRPDGLVGVRVLESVPLAGGQHLHVVALGNGGQLLVGSNGSTLMVKLTELPPQGTARAGVGSSAVADDAAASPSSQGGASRVPAAPGPEAAGFQAHLTNAEQPAEDFQDELAATLRQVLFPRKEP